ncbi:MAG: hypothetical protein HC778_00380 [Chamaesiphon sp. CSU_1_12]|nr:hypothetical protein [Chamaesiphon sp. CSU_1_12]
MVKPIALLRIDRYIASQCCEVQNIMYKGSDLIGKPVVAHDTGEVIADVNDLIIDRSNHQLVGIIVEEKTWFHEAAVIAFDRISAILPTALMVDNLAAIVSASEIPQIQQILDRDLVLSGTQLTSIEGIYLGTISDVFFDQTTGEIDSYEAAREQTDADLKHAYVPIPDPLIIGDDFAVVPLEVMPVIVERSRIAADRVQPFEIEPPIQLVDRTNLSPSDRADLDNNYFG